MARNPCAAWIPLCGTDFNLTDSLSSDDYKLFLRDCVRRSFGQDASKRAHDPHPRMKAVSRLVVLDLVWLGYSRATSDPVPVGDEPAPLLATHEICAAGEIECRHDVLHRRRADSLIHRNQAIALLQKLGH